jgi:hypothetical protein
MDPELAPDLLDMALRRALRDEQPSRDLPVGQPLSDQICHLALAAGETGRTHKNPQEHTNDARSPKTGTEFRYRSRYLYA